MQLTYEYLGVLHICDLNLARVVQQVHAAFLKVLQDDALPVTCDSHRSASDQL